MFTPAPSQRVSGDKEAQLSNIALLYYGEGLTQGEIAKRMKVSRTTVVNMLRESRELGIVEIRVDGRHLTESTLARELREKFGLEDTYVARSHEGIDAPDRAEYLEHFARVAATAILHIVEPGDRIGVAWGETIMAVADAMPRNPVAEVEICQLIGSMISDRVPASENCAIQIANKLAAACYTLHAPGLVSTAELARVIKDEPTIKAQIKRLQALDLTIASIGNVAPDTHLYAAGMVTDDELQAAREAGAKGVFCCRYIGEDGKEVVLPPHDRLIAATVADVQAAKRRFLAVCGEDRDEATLAALRAGLATHLCVDQYLAKFLINA